MTALVPFDDEPLRTWVAHGLRCALMRAPMYNAINGYVRCLGFTQEQTEQVQVHGDVTYGVNDDGWIGFDTLHCGDRWSGDYGAARPDDRTWTEDDVATETERLALSVKTVFEQ